MRKIAGLLLSLAFLMQGCATGGLSGVGSSPSATDDASGFPAEAAESTAAEIPAAGRAEAVAPEKSSVFRGQSVGDNAPARQSSPAITALIGQAVRAEQQGDLARAAASIERGLRIAPHDASLWHKLASIRLGQGRPQQAESLAKKSNSLARGNRKILFSNWMTIAESREQRGDKKGKTRAQKEARRYK